MRRTYILAKILTLSIKYTYDLLQPIFIAQDMANESIQGNR
jgi:hypothetical protein